MDRKGSAPWGSSASRAEGRGGDRTESHASTYPRAVMRPHSLRHRRGRSGARAEDHAARLAPDQRAATLDLAALLQGDPPETVAARPVGPESRNDDPGPAGTDPLVETVGLRVQDRKSTRLNSSHVKNSYAVFCLK